MGVFADEIAQTLRVSDVITVTIIPVSMRLQMLHCTHNAPSAGHQGSDKTLNCLQ